jgi:hypothetical protein
MGIHYAHCIIPRDRTVRPEPGRIVALIEAWIERGFVVRPEKGQAQGPRESSRRKSETGARFKTGPLFEEALKRQQAPEPPRSFLARLLGKSQKPPRPDLWMPLSLPPVGDSLRALAYPSTLIEWDSNPSATYPMQTVTEPLARGEEGLLHQLIIELSDDFANPHTDVIGGAAKQVNPICKCGCDLEYEDALGWLATEKIRRICPACGLSFRPQDHIAEIVNGITGVRSPQPGGLCNRFSIIIDFDKEWPRNMRGADGNNLIEPKVTPYFLKTCSDVLGIELNEFSYYS